MRLAIAAGEKGGLERGRVVHFKVARLQYLYFELGNEIGAVCVAAEPLQPRGHPFLAYSCRLLRGGQGAMCNPKQRAGAALILALGCFAPEKPQPQVMLGT